MTVDRDYDWNVDAKPPTLGGSPGTAGPFDRARIHRGVKMLVVVAAAASTLLWAALLAIMAGSLVFN